MSVVGLDLGALIGPIVLTETVFSGPGSHQVGEARPAARHFTVGSLPERPQAGLEPLHPLLSSAAHVGVAE